MARTVALNLLLKVSGSQSVDEAQKKIGQLQGKLQKFNDVANKVGIGAGVALGAGLVGALDVSKGQAKLAAQLGLTEKESKRVGDVAGKVFAGAYGESMEQVNDAVKSVVQNISGMRTASSSALQETTQRALTLADVMGEDVNKVTAAVSTLMKTGLAPNSKAAFDVITRGAQLGGNKQQDLLDTLTEYPTLFKNMGLSATQATGLIVQGLNAGARSSDLVADAIKEFSIRAVDGSKLTTQGFAALGLNADIMASKIAKGGKSSREALDLTLDRLRAMKDPVDRSRTAVALFGTQAEDLGQALFSLDLDTAANGMGKVAGAADQASKTMGESASARIETFKRTLMTTFVNVLGNTVLPKIQAFIDFLGRMGVTPSGIIAVGAAIAGVALTVKVVTGAIALYNLALKAQAVATKIGTAATWLFNAALRANPIGIVITVLTALVAAIVLAYNKSETFRNIVQAAWRGIQQAVSFAWNSVLKPAFEAIKSWIVNELAPRFLWFHNNIVAPAFKAISFAVKVAWGIIKIIFEAIKFYITKVVAPVVSWLWKNIVEPAFKGIWFAIKVAWGIIKIIFEAIKFYISKVVAPVVSWLWQNIVKPVFDFIGKHIGNVWRTFIKPAFDAIKAAIKLVANSFQTAVTNIGKFWDKLKDAAKKPVKWVIDTVYTGGIKRIWDNIASKVGASPLPDAPRFAMGGKVNGPGGSKSDKVNALLSRGEYVVNASATRRNLPILEAINKRGGPDARAAKANAFMGDPGGVLPGFAGGGLVEGLSKFFASAREFFAGGAVKAARFVTNPLLSLGDKALGGTAFGRMIMQSVRKIIDSVLGWIEGKEPKLGGNGRKAVNAARSQIGTPYSWGGGGPGGPGYGFAQGAGIRGFDCSSLMQYAWYKATGKVIPRTTYTQMPWVKRIGSPVEGALGFPNSGHVFMYSGNRKVIEAPYTGSHVREVPMRNAWWGMPPFATADDGTAVLHPGMNAIYNGTGAMEPLMHPALAGSNVTVQNLNLYFADDRDMYTKGKHFAEGLTAYTKRAGKGWAKNIGITP